MTQHDALVCLRQMRDHAQEAITLTTGKTRRDLDTDRVLNLAMVRLMEVVGEAANRVSPQDRATYSSVPWPQIIGLRHRLIHGYDQVDFDILWEIVTHHFPPLVAQLEKILREG